jgi:hypothetical protein
VKSTIPAHNGSNPPSSHLSLPLRLSKEFSGNATDVSGFNITVTGTTFPNSFKDIDAEGNPLYYIEILDGTHIGLRLDIKDVSGDTITLDESVGNILDKDVSFSVTKYWTLGEIFGKEGELVGIVPYIWDNDNVAGYHFDMMSWLLAKSGYNPYFICQKPSYLDGISLIIDLVYDDTITLDESVGNILGKGVSFSLTKYGTLGEIFGKEGELIGILPYIGGNDIVADSHFDTVRCLDAKSSYNTYFIWQKPSYLGGGKLWVSLQSILTGNYFKDFSNTRIFENTMEIGRIGASWPELTIINTGALKQDKSRVPIFPGSNLVSLSHPIARTLNTSNLQESGFLAGNSIEDSDQLTMIQNGKIQQYYLRKIPNSLGGGTAWQKAGAPANSDYGNDAMFGPVHITRKSNSSFDWVQEPPFSL